MDLRFASRVQHEDLWKDEYTSDFWWVGDTPMRTVMFLRAAVAIAAVIRCHAPS